MRELDRLREDESGKKVEKGGKRGGIVKDGREGVRRIREKDRERER